MLLIEGFHLVSKSPRRFNRTLVLSVLSLAVLIWAAIRSFDISPEDMLTFFVGVLWVVAGVILLAGLCAALWVTLRRLFSGGGS